MPRPRGGRPGSRWGGAHTRPLARAGGGGRDTPRPVSCQDQEVERNPSAVHSDSEGEGAKQGEREARRQGDAQVVVNRERKQLHDGGGQRPAAGGGGRGKGQGPQGGGGG